MFYRNRNIAAILNTLRLHLRLVRALQMASGYQERFIHRACDSLQIGRPQVLDRGLNLDFEVLRSKLVKKWGAQNEAKNNNHQLQVCTSIADSYSTSQATTAREIEGRS